MHFISKLPNLPTSIFSVMAALAKKHNAINLSQGFPNFDCHPKLKELCDHYIQSGHNQYAPMGGMPILNERIAEKIENMHGSVYHPATEITITAGATQAIFCAIMALVQPEDEVILFEPAYDSYAPVVQAAGGKVVSYTLKAPDWEIDWTAFAQLVSKKTKLIVVNTPHNPTGKMWTKADFEALEKIVQDTSILILCDEVYEHMHFDGNIHQSILKFPTLRERSLATFSFGKTLHSTGWKLGYIVADKPLMDAFRRIHQFNVFSVNTPMQLAIADYIKEPEVYLELPDFFQKKRDFFLHLIKDSLFDCKPCDGTYFQVGDYSKICKEKDTDFAVRMTKDLGVAVIPMSPFYSKNAPEDQFLVRFCFAKTDDILEKAAEKLCAIQPIN